MRIIDIQVRSRKHAQEYQPDVPWAAISVSTDPDQFPKLKTENRVGLLQLSFWDIGQEWKEFQDKAFNHQQAQQIFDFLKAVPDIQALLVHCEMGLSRSPAIAAAIAHTMYGPEASKVYFNRFTPNHFVYKTMLEQYEASRPQST